ncbi:TIGR04222 domain-containing membrane protein [Streptomyces sp. NPDC058877]|uniref:TIGR04222 domain-containing membrane protein n=1 Tax=Streptomyces sp. NPDC058877 TaxID=3346665 RepID=UPI003677BCED
MLWVPLLLVAYVVAGTGCVRACRAALAAARPHGTATGPSGGTGLTVCEAAYLAGGPLRVADLTLVSMHRAHRLLLARTGWATVLDAGGAGDAWERAVLEAVGPEGQSPVPAVRPVVAAADSVRRLARDLVARGLAVSEECLKEVEAGMRAVRAGFLSTLLLGTTAALLVPGSERAPVVAAFSLPLLGSGLCLLIGRIEVHPYTRWASPAGQRLLSGLSPADPLTAFAVRGPAALEPELRAALRD